MRYANIKKASRDEQQNQTTTTNYNHIKHFVRFKKQNLITKSKWRQKKPKLNKITCNLPEKIWDQSIIGPGNNWIIENKKNKIKLFLKNI